MSYTTVTPRRLRRADRPLDHLTHLARHREAFAREAVESAFGQRGSAALDHADFIDRPAGEILHYGRRPIFVRRWSP